MNYNSNKIVGYKDNDKRRQVDRGDSVSIYCRKTSGQCLLEPSVFLLCCFAENIRVEASVLCSPVRRYKRMQKRACCREIPMK